MRFPFTASDLARGLELLYGPEVAAQAARGVVNAFAETDAVGWGLSLDALALMMLASRDLERKVIAFVATVPGLDVARLRERVVEVRGELERSGNLPP